MKKRIFSSIRFKLTLWYALILITIVTFSGWFLLTRFETSLMQAIDTTLYTAAEEVEHSLLLNPPESWQREIRTVEKEFLVNRLFIQVYNLPEKQDWGPRLIAKSGVLQGNVPTRRIAPYLREGKITTPLYLSINEESIHSHPLRILLFPLYKNGVQTHVIQVGISLKKVQVTVKKFFLMLLIFFPIILVLSSLVVYAILHRALLPVARVVRTTRAITTEDLSLRIDPRGRKDEIGALIRTFNQMIARLEKSVGHMKHFSQEVSHDLRTPLTIIRGEIETTLRKNRAVTQYITTLNSIHEETVKLEKMITSLLLISQIDSRGNRKTFTEVDLDEVALKVFERMEPVARKKNLKLQTQRIDSTRVFGDPTMLTQMLMNVVENAILYTPPGGIVTINLEETDGHARLAIQDNGIGIPDEARPRLYERFFRVEQGRSDTKSHLGIGLSIVKRIVDLHQATIDIQGPPRSGTKVTIIFPPLETAGNPSRSGDGNIKKN